MCGTSSHDLPLIQASSGCDCCSPQGITTAEPAVAADTADAGYQPTQFKVTGMTCGHCVTGTEYISADTVRAAVSAAGHEPTGTV
jgi:hypothetical protein